MADADLRTSQLSVSPTQDPTTGRVTGYEVNNLLTATLRDIGRAGAVIDAAGAAAGDAVRVQQLEFSRGRRQRPARPGPGRRRAPGAEAGPAAGRGGRGERWARSARSPRSPAEPADPLPSGTPAAAQAAVPILPGTQELQVEVEIVYEMR